MTPRLSRVQSFPGLRAETVMWTDECQKLVAYRRELPTETQRMVTLSPDKPVRSRSDPTPLREIHSKNPLITCVARPAIQTDDRFFRSIGL